MMLRTILLAMLATLPMLAPPAQAADALQARYWTNGVIESDATICAYAPDAVGDGPFCDIGVLEGSIVATAHDVLGRAVDLRVVHDANGHVRVALGPTATTGTIDVVRA